MKTILAITSAVLLSAAAIPAAAQSADAVKISVSYADLDLSHPAGRAVLEQRISEAVDTVCAGRPAPTQLNQQQLYRACQQHAWSGARQQMARAYSGEKLAAVSIRVNGQGK